MADLSAQIKSIQDKLQLLLRQQAALQKENQRLKTDLQRAQTENEEKNGSVQRLQHQLDALKIGSGHLSEEEKAALSRKIDNYLREIDKCLALLNT